MKELLDKMRKRAEAGYEPTQGEVKRAHSEAASDVLGMSGAMLSGSKTAPEGETVYWNACIFNDAGEQIWHGDLNLSRRADDLQELANRVGTIHVTPEQPFRFEGLRAGRKEQRERIRTFERSDHG